MHLLQMQSEDADIVRKEAAPKLNVENPFHRLELVLLPDEEESPPSLTTGSGPREAEEPTQHKAKQ